MASHKRYKKHLSRYVKESLRKGYSLGAVEKALVIYGYEPAFVKGLIKSYKLKDIAIKAIPIFILLIAAMFAHFFPKAPATGYVTAAKSLNFTDKISLNINESGEYAWDLGHKGRLESVRLNGKVAAAGFAKAYLEYGNSTYLIFDSRELKSSLEEVTAFAVKEGDEEEKEKGDKEKEKGKKEKNESEAPINETPALNETLEINITPIINETINTTIPLDDVNETPTANETINQTNETAADTTANETRAIAISLAYNAGTIYDADDNGEETINGVVDLTVENTKFNWDVDAAKLCARWEVYSVEEEKSTTFCNGNGECCAFVNLLPRSGNWSEPYYAVFGKDGAGHENIASAQVLYYDVNLSIENPKSEIYYSNWGNLSAKFLEEYIQFKGVCIETCILPGLNATSYRLKFEIGNSSLILDGIGYEVLGNETINNAPVLTKNISDIHFYGGQTYSINLSGHFYDEDGDILAFGHYNVSEISIEIINETAVLTAGGFIGATYIYFTANDSTSMALSNVFKVEVKEKPKGMKSLRKIVGIL